jgi:hypothetical protein
MRKATLAPLLPSWEPETISLFRYGDSSLEQIAGTTNVLVRWSNGTTSYPFSPDFTDYFTLLKMFRQSVNRLEGKPCFSPGFLEVLDILDGAL